MSVKLIYEDVAVGASEDAALSASDAQAFSDLDALPVGVDTSPIATLELNTWGLDGTYRLLRDQPVGYWSESMSDENGDFQTPPVISIDFDNQYTSLGLYLRFDTASEDYSKELTVSWYRGEIELSSKTFYPTGTSYFCANTVTAYNRIVIEFKATNLPYRYVKLSQIIFGIVREFNIEELRNVDLLLEIDPLSSELSINTMDWTLDSLDDVEYIFQQKQPVKAYDNDSLIGVFYIDTSKRLASRIYDISCVDAIGVLDDSDFQAGIYTDKNAKELILEILNGDFELEMDSSLEDETISGYLDSGTRREALQQVAFVIGAIADTSGSEKIRVLPMPESGEDEITEAETFLTGDVETASLVTAVKVTAHTYTQGSGSSGDDVVEVNGVKYVHKTEITTIENPNVTASDKPNVVEVKEATLVNPSNVAAVAQRVYNDAMRRNLLNGRIVVNGQKPGDYTTMHTMFGSAISGNIISMSVKMSGIVAADVTLKGA